MAETAPDVLYHYCTLDTFYNIMKNQSIWLSDVTKSNDSKELVWATRQCEIAVIRKFLEYSERMKANDNFINTRFVDFHKITDQFQSMDTSKSLKSWVFCLSEKGDNLGQWRGYADDGKGISIGFYSSIFNSQIPTINGPMDFNQDKIYCIFDKIEYDTFDINQLLTPADLNILSSSCEFEELEGCFRKLMLYATVLAPLYKSDAFAEEKEWRLVYQTNTKALMNGMIPSKSNLYSEEPMFEIVDYSFTPKNNTLISHIELKIKDIKNAIASVTIGPKSNLTELDVKLFLISIGLLHDIKDESIKVLRSSASYR